MLTCVSHIFKNGSEPSFWHYLKKITAIKLSADLSSVHETSPKSSNVWENSTHAETKNFIIMHRLERQCDIVKRCTCRTAKLTMETKCKTSRLSMCGLMSTTCIISYFVEYSFQSHALGTVAKRRTTTRQDTDNDSNLK